MALGEAPHRWRASAIMTGAAVAMSAFALLLLRRRRKTRKTASAETFDDKLANIVSYSSCMIAASRALESERPDALVVDPLASVLAGKALAESRAKSQAEAGKDTTWRIAIRTKYFDNVIESFLQDTAKAADSAQVVHLGAGMDSRPFRLDAPAGTIFFELDNEDVLALKEELLCGASESSEIGDMIMRGNSRRKTVVCNIELHGGTGCKSPLLEAGFDQTKPTCWVLEGLTYYICDEATMCGIFSTMRQLSAPGSQLVVSVASTASLRRARAAKMSLMQSWKWGSDQPDLLLTECGWDCGSDDVVALGDDRANYGRFQRSEASDAGGREIGRRSGIMYVTARC